MKRSNQHCGELSRSLPTQANQIPLSRVSVRHGLRHATLGRYFRCRDQRFQLLNYCGPFLQNYGRRIEQSRSPMQNIGRFSIDVSRQPNKTVDLHVAIWRDQAKHVRQVSICLMRPSRNFFWLADCDVGIIRNAFDA